MLTIVPAVRSERPARTQSSSSAAAAGIHDEVESIAKKHEHIPIDKTVLWSANGFYAPALAKAKFLKMDTVSQRDAIETPWRNLARELIGGLAMHLIPVFTPVVDVTSPTGAGQRILPTPGMTLRTSVDGLPIELDRLLLVMRSSPELPTVLLDHAPEGAGDFHIVYTPTDTMDLLDGDVLCGTIRRVIMGIKTLVESGPIKMRSVRVADALLTLATADLASGRLEVLIAEHPEGSPKSSARFRKASDRSNNS